MLFGLVAPLTGSDVGATVFATRSVGPPVTTTLPPNSEVSPAIVAVPVSRVPMATPPGTVMTKAESIGVVGALRDAVDVGRAVGARGGVEICRRILR